MSRQKVNNTSPAVTKEKKNIEQVGGMESADPLLLTPENPSKTQGRSVEVIRAWDIWWLSCTASPPLFSYAAPHFPECMLRWDSSSCSNGHHLTVCVLHQQVPACGICTPRGISSCPGIRGKNTATGSTSAKSRSYNGLAMGGYSSSCDRAMRCVGPRFYMVHRWGGGGRMKIVCGGWKKRGWAWQGDGSAWEAASNQMSSPSLSPFVFSEDAELLPDNKAPPSRTNAQAVKYS